MLDSTTQDDLALDKVAVAALRQADTISFHHNGGKSFINASKRLVRNERDPFAPDEIGHRIACHARITDYDREGSGFGIQVWRPGELNGYRCFEMDHSPRELNGLWQTIAGLLRPGDELTLHWSRGGKGTLGLKDNGMVGDALHLLVTRGEKHMKFLLDTYCGPDNTARMCRLTGYNIA